MKYIKKYESTSADPQEGDYVICQDEAYSGKADLNIFLAETVGYITDINRFGRDYNIRYDAKIPEKLLYHFFDSVKGRLETYKQLNVVRKEIVHFSHNKEDLESMIAAKKYNL